MEMSGEQRIEAPREIVWAALNDPDILKNCIPGCQELDKRNDTEMTAVAVIKVGPVSARFQGTVTLSDLDPPNGYRITGEGQGGVAGFARGSAEVHLVPDGPSTVLRYAVSAQIGGKLSQLGGRLIDATARKMSNAFFKRFAEEIALRQGTTGAGATEFSASGTAATERPPEDRDASTYLQPSQGKRSHVGTLVSQGGSRWSLWLNTAVLVAAVIVMSLTMSRGVLSPSGADIAASGAIPTEFIFALQTFLFVAIGYLLGRHHEAGADRALDRQLLLNLLADRRGSGS